MNLLENKDNGSSGETHQVVGQAARSVKWSFLYNLVPRLVTPFSTMILAGLLTPADFGLVAISTFVMALATILVDLGLGKAVVQNRTNVDEFASISMWISVIMSLGWYAIIWLVSPWIADLYHNPAVIDVVRVSSLSLPFTAVTAVPKGLMRREMQFERLFWVNSSFLIVQAVAAVIFAFFGVGAWALIWGQLVGQTVSCVIVWATTTWRPNLVWNWEIARTQIRFSLWIMLSSFQTWLFLYADNAIAGMFLGVTGLGVYSLGFNISIIIPTFMVAALSDVAYPAFCKLDGDAAKVGKSLIGLQRLTSAILFPIAFGIASIASPAVALLYGDKWEGLGMVIGLLGIMPGLSSIWNLNESAYLSIGKPDIHTKLSALSLLILLPTLWAAAPYGLFVFTAARFAGAFILPLAHIIVGTRSLELKIFEQLKRLFLPLVAALVMFAAVYFAVTQLQPFSGWMGWIKLLLAIILGAFIYALTLFLFGRELLNDLFGGVKRVLARGNA